MHEAVKHKVGMLSYSPRQIVHAGVGNGRSCRWFFASWRWLIRQPKSPIPRSASLLPTDSFYSSSAKLIGKLGGHPSVADKVLEDVELAFLAKRPQE
jgi:hypothetical protein